MKQPGQGLGAYRAGEVLCESRHPRLDPKSYSSSVPTFLARRSPWQCFNLPGLE